MGACCSTSAHFYYSLNIVHQRPKVSRQTIAIYSDDKPKYEAILSRRVMLGAYPNSKPDQKMVAGKQFIPTNTARAGTNQIMPDSSRKSSS